MTATGPSETRYARAADGSRLAYRVLGDGPVDLFWSFSHLNDVEAVWDYPPIADFLRSLGDGGRLIVHDRRGMGRSGGSLADPETEVEDLQWLFDAVDAERPFLLGAVMGGAAYVSFAARNPDRVAGLVWHGPFARSLWAPDYPWASTQDELDEYASGLAQGWGSEPFAASFVAAGAPSMAGDDAATRFFARWMRQTADAQTIVAHNRAWDTVDLRPLLPRVRTPTLLTLRAGERGEAEYVGSLIPGARVVLFDGDDFMPFYGAEPIVATIREFVYGPTG